MTLTLFLAKLLGAYMIVMSAWLLLRSDVATQFMQRLSANSVAVAVIGMIRLAIGLAMVIGHDLWGSGVEILVSLLGWVILLSGLLTLFLPDESLRALMTRLRYPERLPIFALVTFALGASLLIGAVTG